MLTQELARLPLFKGFQVRHLEQLAPLFHRVHFRAGTKVFNEGDRASELYLVEAGEVAIRLRPHDGGVLELSTAQPGSIFGWSAALNRLRYTSSAVCLTDVQALAIGGDDLREAMRADPELQALLFERLAQTVASRFESIRTQLVKLFHQRFNEGIRPMSEELGNGKT
ncbi:MAG TPA: cyclic nucleotide-binding domain-containing protein [Anaerolineae bacterium]|nr:cyclic nucleotide-binding domain-containing protein [Anaerolineae bacterium]